MLIYLWIVVLCLLSITGPVDTLSHRWISSQHLKRNSIYIPFALEQRRIISLHASSVHEDKIATTSTNKRISNKYHKCPRTFTNINEFELHSNVDIIIPIFKSIFVSHYCFEQKNI